MRRKFPFLSHKNSVQYEKAEIKCHAMVLVFDCFSLFLIAFIFFFQLFFLLLYSHYSCFCQSLVLMDMLVFDVSETEAILIYYFHFFLHLYHSFSLSPSLFLSFHILFNICIFCCLYECLTVRKIFKECSLYQIYTCTLYVLF